MARMARTDQRTEVPIDRQGRLVVPRHLRDGLGPVPGVVTARRVDEGILLEAPPNGELSVADDGLPVLVIDGTVTNEQVLAAIDAERDQR